MNTLKKVTILICCLVAGALQYHYLIYPMIKEDPTKKEYVLTDRDLEISTVLDISPEKIKFVMEKFGEEEGRKALNKAMAIRAAETIHELAKEWNFTKEKDDEDFGF